MEAAQARAKLAKPPISDEAFVAIVNCEMLGTDEYVDKTKAWNNCRPCQRMWANWNPVYREAYTENQ